MTHLVEHSSRWTPDSSSSRRPSEGALHQLDLPALAQPGDDLGEVRHRGRSVRLWSTSAAMTHRRGHRRDPLAIDGAPDRAVDDRLQRVGDCLHPDERHVRADPGPVDDRADEVRSDQGAQDVMGDQAAVAVVPDGVPPLVACHDPRVTLPAGDLPRHPRDLAVVRHDRPGADGVGQGTQRVGVERLPVQRVVGEAGAPGQHEQRVRRAAVHAPTVEPPPRRGTRPLGSRHAAAERRGAGLPGRRVARGVAAQRARPVARDLEVVVVDDGSTDGTGELADRIAGEDDRVRVVHQANAGLGAARNAGTAVAGGELLAFADSDDLVLPGAYELLVGSLRASGSDLAIGAVERLRGTETFVTPLMRVNHEHPLTGVRIDEAPLLLADVFAWNKVYRRSFWDAHGLRFPGASATRTSRPSPRRSSSPVRLPRRAGLPVAGARRRDLDQPAAR